MKLRPETAGDIPAIRALTDAAFATTTFSDGTEGAVLDQMREDGDILLSLVAEIDGEVVGQVTLSEASVGGAEGWIGLGPIAVTPARFHQGIGGAMIRAALDWARERGAAGMVLTGADTYYPRFGFESGEVSYLTTPTRFTMRHVLNGPPASGEIVFAGALQEAG